MEKKLGLSALTALVLSSMLGAGVFSLPQNMAAVASPSALLIGWAIPVVGILFLAFAMLLWLASIILQNSVLLSASLYFLVGSIAFAVIYAGAGSRFKK